jgi:TolB-like protein
VDALASHVIYEFGDFRLDAGRRVLCVRGEPKHLPISPHVFEAVLYFVEHAGELLAKDRLLAALWPGMVVEENSLNRVVSSLRHVLGEAPGDNRYIATVPGRGYCFVADVYRISQHASPRSPDETVAVLPFENLGEHGGDDYIARGVAENILYRLVGVAGIAVVAQTSSFGSLGQDPDVRQIGRPLNARYLVEGSLQRQGGRLRVTAQLVDASHGTHVWSLRFNCMADDVFAAEDEIAQSVAEAIAATVGQQPCRPST